MVDSSYTAIAEKPLKVGPVKVYTGNGYARARLFELDQQTPVTGCRGDLNGVYVATFIGKNARTAGFVYAGKRLAQTMDGTVIFKPEGKFYLIGEPVAEKPKTQRRKKTYLTPVEITAIDGTVTPAPEPRQPRMEQRPRRFDEAYITDINTFLASQRMPRPFDDAYVTELTNFLSSQRRPSLIDEITGYLRGRE